MKQDSKMRLGANEHMIYNERQGLKELKLQNVMIA